MSAVPPSLPVAPAPGLSPEQMRQIHLAGQALKPIRRAVAYATFDGWTIAIFAALSFVCGFSSISGMLLGAGMGIVAYIELHAASRLRQLDPTAPRTLALNQAALAILLIAYAIGRLYEESHGGGALRTLAASDPAAADMLRSFEPLARLLAVAIYGGLILVAVVAQGGAAWFYLSRRKWLAAYLQSTPEWIRQMQQNGLAL